MQQSLYNLMEKYLKIIILVFIVGLISCNNIANKKTTNEDVQFDCNSLTDKKIIYKIGKSIIDKHDNKQIGNLYEIDTTNFFTIEDYFTNSKSKDRLILVGGMAGMSAGTADNLLLILSCSNKFEILWAGQVGDFTQTDINDLDGDTIKEIISNQSMMWMGECNDRYAVFNFKDYKHNVLFEAEARSVIDCGNEDLAKVYNQGDTLETNLDYLVMKISDREYEIRQIRAIKIHNGGQTNKKILKNIKTFLDTTIIKLK